MASILFLAVRPVQGHPLLVENAITTGEIESVGAAYVELQTGKQQFIESDEWMLLEPDAMFACCAKFREWCGLKGPDLILAFDGPIVVRRLAGLFAYHKFRFIPAPWWCGARSRTFDIVNYFSGEETTTAFELLTNAKLVLPTNWQPHEDHKSDLAHLIELGVRYHLLQQPDAAHEPDADWGESAVTTNELVKADETTRRLSHKSKTKFSTTRR